MSMKFLKSRNKFVLFENTRTKNEIVSNQRAAFCCPLDVSCVPLSSVTQETVASVRPSVHPSYPTSQIACKSKIEIRFFINFFVRHLSSESSAQN